MLTFNVYFKYDKDEVYMSYCYSYTYINLKSFINKKLNARNRVRKISIVQDTYWKWFRYNHNNNFILKIEEIAERPAVKLSARSHSSESNFSIIMKGILDFLISDKAALWRQRNLFVFKIIQMSNPDGVFI